MRILITAIGSMSAECAIKTLRNQGHYIIGCDIYEKEWHIESFLCDNFYKAPFATNAKDYVNFLLNICKKEHLNYIIPLTDLEIDVISSHRQLFDDAHICLCMQNTDVLRITRDKFRLYETFKNDEKVPSIKTSLLSNLDPTITFPCIAKPYNGRSSEGLIRNASKEQLIAIENADAYIVQEQIDGNVFTVDYCRSSAFGTDAAVPRQELLRTKNGAGLTVKICNDPALLRLVSYIGNRLNINGCVNMEFIFSQGKYYLIDINPRFSAGVAFSNKMGYDMITNHLNCFLSLPIDKQINLEEKIIIKKYTEAFV